MAERFVFELVLGDETVKRVTFATGRGRRELLTSGGQIIGHLVLKPGGIRLELDDDAAQELAHADFTTN